MRKRQLLSMPFLALLGTSVFGQCPDGSVAPPTTNLIISEWRTMNTKDADAGDTGNPSDTRNSYFEIYNGTGSNVDLSNFVVLYGKNGDGLGANNGDTLKFTQTLQNGYVLTVGRAEAFDIINKIDVQWANFKPNGDEQIGLYDTSAGPGQWVQIDAFGDPDTRGDLSPAKGWDVAGETEATANNVLVRKSSVTEGNLDWDASRGTSSTDSEWQVNERDDFSGTGIPTCETPSGTSVVYTTEFSVYQSNGQLVIESSAPQAIRISDVNGVTISEISVESGKNVTNVNLEDGIYVFTSETSAPIKTMIK